MREDDHEIREGLKRLSLPAPGDEPLTFERIAKRRGQRRVRAALLVLVPLVLVGVLGVVALPSTEETVVAAEDVDGSPPPSADPAQGVSSGPALEDEACDPVVFGADPFGDFPDIRARTSSDHEVWALFFFTGARAIGNHLIVEVDRELKIVWQADGEGEVEMVAVGPDGVEVPPTFGPSLHAGSNWDRVPGGDEWGTGWVFPTEGCWRLQLSRDDVLIASIDLEAAS